MSAQFGQPSNGFPYQHSLKPSLNAGFGNRPAGSLFGSVTFGTNAAPQFAQPGQTFVSSTRKTPPMAGNRPGTGSSARTTRSGQPQFGGLGYSGLGYSLLGKGLFLAPVISVFSALDQLSSMLSVAFRDFFDSTGRIFQEWKRNRHGGRESFIEELGTTLVWGFGIGLCKSGYNWLIPKLNRHIQLPSLDLDLLPRDAQPENGLAKRWNAAMGRKGALSTVKGWMNQAITKWDRFVTQQPGAQYVFGTIRDTVEPGKPTPPDSTRIQQLNPGVIKKHYGRLSPETVSLEAPKGLWQKVLSIFNKQTDFKAQSEHLLLLIEGAARQAHLERYMGSNLGKLFLCTTLPVLAIGFGIPTFNQWLTRKMVTKEKLQQWQESLRAAQKKLQPTAIRKKVGGAFSGFENAIIPLLPGMNNAIPPAGAAGTALNSVAAGLYGGASFGARPANAAGLNPMSPNPMNPALPGQAPMAAAPSAGHPKFAGILSALSPLTSFFLSHENLNTMTFVDFPLSSSRVYKSRNGDERIERAFREVALIVVLFYLQRAIQTRINKVFNTKLGANTQIDARALHRLHSSFVSGNASFDAAFRGLEKTLSLVKRSASEEQAEIDLVAELRDYFSPQRRKGYSNLLYDLAEASGHLHTMGVAGRKYVATGNNAHIIDITQKINTEGIRDLAHYLEHLNGIQAAGKEALARELVRNTGMKMGAFALSALACWGIVSWLVPKVQHWITYKRTGRDFFPGVENA